MLAAATFLAPVTLPATSAVGFETNGIVVVEAEDFAQQAKTNLREWQRIDGKTPCDPA